MHHYLEYEDPLTLIEELISKQEEILEGIRKLKEPIGGENMKELHRLKRNEQQVKTLEDIIKVLKAHGKEVAEKYGIKNIRIFGSYTEGKQRETSDLDLIVVFEKTPSLIELVRIEEELGKMVGVKVDLLTEEAISPFIKPYVREVEVLP
ncbi:nucleotidyltransferase family protein [Caldicoprobacter algeriensis]|uniref:nucleotidyltransferase family protein n=1 Tax=Caldicoprobacter algeriensis TaxID=699281 RepID=UPI0020792406|nr:nucleotidyltransferase family protein [Caldicoprobacter algeriensis]